VSQNNPQPDERQRRRDDNDIRRRHDEPPQWVVEAGKAYWNTMTTILWIGAILIAIPFVLAIILILVAGFLMSFAPNPGQP
jgi:hypothetical protein